MSALPDYLTPELWIEQVFSSGEAARGGIVKRQVRDVERLAGVDLFLTEAEKRGYQVLRNRRHYIVFCNGDPIRRVRR